MFLGQSVIISSEESQNLISYAQPLLEESKLGSAANYSQAKSKNQKRRSYHIMRKVSPHHITFFDKLSESVSKYSNFILKDNIPIKTNIIKYPTGGFLYKHDDTYHEGLRLVGVGNLNEGYEGGIFKTDEKNLNLGTGNVAWFLPNLQHEVTEVLKGERWSIVFWLFNENLVINKAAI